MSKTIVITGANGFIGRYLTEYFSYLKYDVIALIHKTYKAAIKGVEYRQFDMNSFSGDIIPENALAIIHCAYIPWQKGNNSDEQNMKATSRLLQIARKKNVGKFVFLSSFSAFEDALSHYGKSKFQLEKLFDSHKDLIIRPALVKGDGGLWKNMGTTIQKNKFVPLIGGGNQPVQIIEIRLLAEVVIQGIERNISGYYNIADGKAYPIKELYRKFAKQKESKTFFIPIPYFIAKFLIKIMGIVSNNPPVTEENLLGLKQMKERDFIDIKSIFGVDKELI